MGGGLEEGKYAETPLGLSWRTPSGLLKSSGAILRLNLNKRGRWLKYANTLGNLRIAPENGIAESRTLDN